MRISENLPGSMTGSIFAADSAVGYILVVAAALCLGGLATLLAIRLRKRAKDQDEED